MIYLRRRAWRYLRLLGQAVPDAYPDVRRRGAAALPGGRSAAYQASWVAAKIWGHKQLKGQRGAYFARRTASTARAYPDVVEGVAGAAAAPARPGPQRPRDPSSRSARCARITRSRCAPSSRRGSRGSAAGPSAALHSFVVSLFKDSAGAPPVAAARARAARRRARLAAVAGGGRARLRARVRGRARARHRGRGAGRADRAVAPRPRS